MTSSTTNPSLNYLPKKSFVGSLTLGASRSLPQIPLILSYWFLLFLFGFPYWEAIGLYVALITVSPYDKLKTLSRLNLFFPLLAGTALSFAPHFMDAKIVEYSMLPDEKTPLIVHLGIAVCFCIYYYLVFTLMAKYKRLRLPLIASLALLLCFSGLFYLSSGTVSKMILGGLIFILTRSFWAMTYQFSEVDYLKTKSFFDHLGTLNSPWQEGWNRSCIMRGYGDYLNNTQPDGESFRQAQVAGVKLALYAVLVKYLADKFYLFLFYNSFYIGGFRFTGLRKLIGTNFTLDGYLAGDLSIPQSWLFLLANTFYFLLSLTAFTNAAISIPRMCGYPIRREVYQPFKATSFINFLSRIYFYYIAILQRFFFYPIWRYLRPVRSRSCRLFITTFLTICGGGVFAAFIRNWSSAVPGGFAEMFIDSMSRAPYFALLGVFAAGSTLWPFKPFLPLYIRGLCYFAMYALCFSLQYSPDPTDFTPRFRTLFYLFGLN